MAWLLESMKITSPARLAVSLALALGACAPAVTSSSTTAPHPVDVAAVRREIKGEIAHDASGRLPADRQIVSMGHVTRELAVVYTDREGKRLEETWVRSGAAWTLKDAQPIGQETASVR